MPRLENIKIRENIGEEEVVKKACHQYNIPMKKVKEYQIIRKSVDARNKKDIFYCYTIDVILQGERKEETTNIEVTVRRKQKVSPVIVGAGPAGLFCALTLVDHGIKPILLEQGKSVEERAKDVQLFLEKGILNSSSNVQFGEGGAGTFSDGKLTTSLHNSFCRYVLETFVKFGAPEQILYVNKPHIGTDYLVQILTKIRKYLVEKGTQLYFQEKLVDLVIQQGTIQGVICEQVENKTRRTIPTDTVIVAIGHSARDTFEMLYQKKLDMQQKNFSVGVRIEHRQKQINEAQYGTQTKLQLPPAEYKLVYHGKERSCYTFCMCPGGQVMASSSEENTVVTNGMSQFARDGENANSALLVEVRASDFPGQSPLEGMYFQKELEEKAFVLGGSSYFAPIQRVEDFLQNRATTKIGSIKPTYLPGVTCCNLQDILPNFVVQTLKEGLLAFDQKLKGFAHPDAILTGVETRSSSPVTIKRDETGMANVIGLYPCGEGAGYAGGIMSAAIDGIRCAISILEKK